MVLMLARFVAELANLQMRGDQPYVGHSAFAHKGGVHVSAVLKDSATYEHIKPELVGNRQRVLVSDLSGRSNILYKAQEFGVDVEELKPAVRSVLAEVKELENRGFQFEGAEASFELLMQKGLNGQKARSFRLIGFRVIVQVAKRDIGALPREGQSGGAPRLPPQSKSASGYGLRRQSEAATALWLWLR